MKSDSNERYKTNLRDKYPHRAGRIRVDRQFTTTLSIGDGSERNKNDDTIMTENIEDSVRYLGEQVTSCISSSDDSDGDDLLSFNPFNDDSISANK